MTRAQVGDIQVNYEQLGQGTDLVLIHGLGNDLHLWDGDVPVLARHHRVLRFDVRGFGESDKPPGPYSVEQFASDLRQLMEACGVVDAHLVGLSMGGVIAQRFALDFVDHVRSLILVSTSSEVGARATAAWQRLADTIEKRGFDERSADARRAFSANFAERHPDLVAEVGRRNAANDPAGYAAAARAVSAYNWTADLAALERPVLVLQGLDDRLTPPGGAVILHRALRHARLLMVEEAGHNLPLEQPAVFHSAVLSFAAGVDLQRGAGR